jgi:hypothetical protein
VLSAIYCGSEQENAPRRDGCSAPEVMARLRDVRLNQVDHVPKGNALAMTSDLSRARQSAKSHYYGGAQKYVKIASLM